MSDWQIDLMVENDRARAWEELNAPDPYEKVLKTAANDLISALSYLNVVTDRLADASSDLSETPMQAKIDSFIDSLESIGCDLSEIKGHWERGERE